MTTVCVHGLGHVGLPTAALFANEGYDVVGYDVDESVIARLREGEIRGEEPGFRAYVERALDGSFSPRGEPVPADYHLVCVPTPYDYDADRADVSAVETVAETVAGLVRPGDAVVVESTVPPGTTSGTVGPIVERSGLSVGSDVDLAYAPETILPGNILEELRHNDRIVGAVGDVATERIAGLFGDVAEGTVHPAPDPTAAEFAKLAQNAYRDLNIAFANELARLGDDYGVDAREAIGLANEHPRVDILRPGLGVGGECLPVDPLFLGQRSDADELVRCARRVNDGMPAHVARTLRDVLGEVVDRSVAVLGVAYKGGVDDARNSPGLQFARELQRLAAHEEPAAPDGGGGVDVRLHDPHVRDETLDLQPLDAALDGADAAVVATDHGAYADLDPERTGELMAGDAVVDTRAVLDAAAWREAGFTVVTV